MLTGAWGILVRGYFFEGLEVACILWLPSGFHVAMGKKKQKTNLKGTNTRDPSPRALL